MSNQNSAPHIAIELINLNSVFNVIIENKALPRFILYGSVSNDKPSSIDSAIVAGGTFRANACNG